MSIEVSRLNILAHPGYVTVQPPLFRSPEALASRETRHQQLLQKYLNHAQEMGPEEVLWVITSADWKTFYRRYRADISYPVVLKKIKAILEKRMILVTDTRTEMDGRVGGRRSVKVLENATKARGFHLSPEVDSVAMGEMFGACATEAAVNVNHYLGLTQKTKLLADLTDWGFFNEDQKRRLGGAQTHWKNLISDFRPYQYRRIMSRVEVVD